MADKLHFEILPKRQRELFEAFEREKWIADFYLAGGTALALQIAHRRSIDFDFFVERPFKPQAVKRRMALIGDYQVSSEQEDIIIDGRINNVRVSFFNTPFPLIGREIKLGNLRIISKEDIAAMKLQAISSRGSRKDFIDLFFLLKELTLAEMFSFYEEKYGKNAENVYCVLKGLIYFADAEAKPMPSLLRRVTWGEIKKRILSAHGEYLSAIK
jgi:predicted nucleotidyltransferase component of viral defense system